MPIDDADVEWLLSLVEGEDLAEIEVHAGDQEVLVRRREATAALSVHELALPVQEEAEPSAEAELPENVIPVAAPMSGVFYRAPSPESPVYVDVGQQVDEGDTVGLIEAMKLFNDVHAPVGGTVTKILVQNEEQVEAGRTLMLIET